MTRSILIKFKSFAHLELEMMDTNVTFSSIMIIKSNYFVFVNIFNDEHNKRLQLN